MEKVIYGSQGSSDCICSRLATPLSLDEQECLVWSCCWWCASEAAAAAAAVYVRNFKVAWQPAAPRDSSAHQLVPGLQWMSVSVAPSESESWVIFDARFLSRAAGEIAAQAGRLNTHKEAIRLQTKYTYVAVVSTNTIVHGSRNKQNTRGKTVERKEKNLKLYETSQSGGKSEFRGWTLLLLLDLCYTWIYTDINFFYR